MGDGEFLFNRLSVWEDDRVLEMDGNEDGTTV